MISLRKIKGVGLIEVLIAIVIISIALLAISQLQLRSYKANQDNIYALQARLLASNAFDKMRIHRQYLNATFIDNINNPPASANINCRGSLGSTNCSAEDFAGYDMWLWTQSIQDRLPNGTATISQSDNLYTIEISWFVRSENATITRSYQSEI